MSTQFWKTTLVLLGLFAPLTAQNFTEDSACPETPSFGRELLEAGKAQSAPSEKPLVFSESDSAIMVPGMARIHRMNTAANLAVLEKSSPFREAASGRLKDASTIPTEGLKQELALASASYREAGKVESNCRNVALSVAQRIHADQSELLEIVNIEVAANPTCACEIVKAAIQASEATVEQVVSIVETAINCAPESMRIVSQCAIAAMPDSLAGVQAVLAKLDPNAGDAGGDSKSAKSAKGGKDAMVASPNIPAPANPLDLPLSNPPLCPPPITPAPVTSVNP